MINLSLLIQDISKNYNSPLKWFLGRGVKTYFENQRQGGVGKAVAVRLGTIDVGQVSTGV